MTHPHRTLLVSVAGMFLLTACGEARSDPASEVVFDTLPNGAVHVQSPQTGIWRDGEGWRLVEELRIGAVDGDGPDVFGSVSDAALGLDGTLYVLDSLARELRVFAPDGAYVATGGGDGDGPGELRSAVGLALDSEGRVWVLDVSNARFAVFSAAGEHLEDRSRQIPSIAIPWTGRFTTEGRLLDVALEATEEGLPTLIAIGTDGDLAPVDSLRFPGHRPPMIEQGPLVAPVPFAPRFTLSFDDRGHVWHAITAPYRILQRSLAGDTLRIVERVYTPTPVTRADLDALLEEPLWRGFVERGGRIDMAQVPEEKPAFERFTVDDRGYLWVRRETRPEGEIPFDVFDAEGRFLGTVHAPSGIPVFPMPRIRGDRMVAVVRDELDVPYVVRFRIEGRGG